MQSASQRQESKIMNEIRKLNEHIRIQISNTVHEILHAYTILILTSLDSSFDDKFNIELACCSLQIIHSK